MLVLKNENKGYEKYRMTGTPNFFFCEVTKLIFFVGLKIASQKKKFELNTLPYIKVVFFKVTNDHTQKVF